MLDGSLRETELPVCAGQPRGRAEAWMSVFLGLVGAFKSTDQNRGAPRDACGRATKWSPHVEDVRCPDIASSAELSRSTKNSVSGILFAPMSFFFFLIGQKGRGEAGEHATPHPPPAFRPRASSVFGGT